MFIVLVVFALFLDGLSSQNSNEKKIGQFQGDVQRLGY